jgi:hypothetical protein
MEGAIAVSKISFRLNWGVNLVEQVSFWWREDRSGIFE